MSCVSPYRAKDGGETFRVRYRLDGRSCSTTFADRSHAERLAALIDLLGPARALESIGLGTTFESEPIQPHPVWVNPNSCFVYILWGEDLKVPLYVGQSASIFTRLGVHMRDATKGGLTRRVQLIECEDEGAMNETEARLIRKYLPSLNTAGKPKRWGNR